MFCKDCWLEIRDLPGDVIFWMRARVVWLSVLCVPYLTGQRGLLAGCCSQSVHVMVLSVLLPSTNVWRFVYITLRFLSKGGQCCTKIVLQDVVSHLTAFAGDSGPTSCLVLVRLRNIRPASPGQFLWVSLFRPASPWQLLQIRPASLGQASFSSSSQLLQARPGQLLQVRPASPWQLLHARPASPGQASFSMPGQLL